MYDIGEGPATIVNPRIEESSGEWVYGGFCCSIPGLYVEMVQPKKCSCTARTSTATRSASERTGARPVVPAPARSPPHVLMFDHMTPDQRRAALTEYPPTCRDAGQPPTTTPTTPPAARDHQRHYQFVHYQSVHSRSIHCWPAARPRTAHPRRPTSPRYAEAAVRPLQALAEAGFNMAGHRRRIDEGRTS